MLAERLELEPSVNLAGIATPSDMERRLTSIINRQRAIAKLPLLRTDLLVAGAARRRSAMAHEARVAGSASTRAAQTPMQRLRGFGVSPQVLLESFLEVDSLARAAEELMNNAVLRTDLEPPTTTDVGVGVALDDATRRLFITITYVQIPPRINPAELAQRLAAEINSVESSKTDLDLARIAQECADGLAIGWRREALWPRINGALTHTERFYGKIGNAVASLVDPAHVDVRALLGGRPADAIGVGVAQSVRYGPLGGSVWVVVFLG